MLRIRVLGDLRLEIDGAGIDAPVGRRAQALLGWLALHPGPHPRSRLASRFWPDVLETSARASLRVALSEVRAALGPAARFVEADRTRVGLAPGVWVDALVFDELAAAGDLAGALTLATGELLPDLDDDWVLDARDDHRLAVIAALGAYATQREAAGDLDQAIALSRRAVALDPLGEATARELMRRLAVAGETAAAADVAARLTAAGVRARRGSECRDARTPRQRACHAA